MTTLTVPVACIGDGGYVFNESADIASIQPAEAKALPIQAVEVSGRFERLGDELLFRGHIRGVFQEACYRCLVSAEVPVEVEVAWVFSEGPDAVFEELGHALEMDDDTALQEPDAVETRHSFQGCEMNLAPYVWEEVVFATPTRFLCDEGCKGLCPQCGLNLNEHTCTCAEKRPDEQIGNHGLAVLGTMFPELAPEPSKE